MQALGKELLVEGQRLKFLLRTDGGVINFVLAPNETIQHRSISDESLKYNETNLDNALPGTVERDKVIIRGNSYIGFGQEKLEAVKSLWLLVLKETASPHLAKLPVDYSGIRIYSPPKELGGNEQPKQSEKKERPKVWVLEIGEADLREDSPRL